MSLVRQFNTRPLYQQVADEFIARIVSKQWAPGQAIENETEIARSLGISLGTVRKAFDILAGYKLLERHQGKGTIVSDLESGPMRGRFSNILDVDGRRVRGEMTVEDASLDFPSAAVAQALGVNVRTPVMHFVRRRSHQGRWFMYEDVYLRVNSTAQTVSQDELDAIARQRWFGQDLATHKVEEVGSASANEKDATLLGVGEFDSVLTLRRVVLSYQGRPLELRLARCSLGPDLLYRSH